MTSVFFAPHNDDEALFGAFTIIRHRPHVVVCFPSARDYGDTERRRDESSQACAVLGAASLTQWDGTDLQVRMRLIDEHAKPSRVFAPHETTSHPDHYAVFEAASRVFGDRLVRYHTYDGGPAHKIRQPSLEVPFEPAWIEMKLRALLCYRTQLQHPRAAAFFANDLAEYYGDAPGDCQ